MAQIPLTTDHDRLIESLRKMKETKLHTDIIIPLLKKQGAKHVEYTHGPSEKGKDIVYVHDDFHGFDRLEVCQVKNSPFSGSAGRENAITVLAQMQQCRRLEVRNPATGVMERPRGVTLYSTYELPQKDVANAQPFLNELRELDCTFLGPEHFAQKIETLLPEIYAELAFPGKTLFRAVRCYVNMHHEATAFDLKNAKNRKLEDFFVNLGVTQTGVWLDKLAKGEVRCRGLESIIMQNVRYRDLLAQFDFISQRLNGFEIFIREGRQLTDTESGVEENKNGGAIRQRGDRLVNHSRIKIIRFCKFLTTLEKYLVSELHDNPVPINPEKVADIVRLIAVASKFTDRLARSLRQEDPITNPQKTKGFRFHIECAPAKSLLALKDNVCIVGAAGAGKTSVARDIARVAFDNNIKCVYFPCSRLTNPRLGLQEGITSFLSEISAKQVTTKDLSEVQLFVIDGCDEAAVESFGRLSQEIAKLAFPRPQTVKVQKHPSDELVIPPDLRGRLTFSSAKCELIQSGPISLDDFDRLIFLHKGSVFEKAFIGLAHKTAEKCPQVVITTREAVLLESLDWFLRIRLSPFTDSQLKEFFENWFPSHKKAAKDILSFLEQNPHIKEVCRTPIISTIIAALYENDYPLPLTRTDVYVKRFELLMERWDKARAVSTRNRILSRDKWTLLQRLALRLQRDHRRVMTRKELVSEWNKGFSHHYPAIKQDELIWELQVCNCLIFPEGPDNFSLGHLSFQEFLAARAIAYGHHGVILRENFNDPRWRQVILFYAGFTGDVSRLLSAVQARKPIEDQSGFIHEVLQESRYTPEAMAQFIRDAGFASDIKEADDYMNDEIGDDDSYYTEEDQESISSDDEWSDDSDD